MFSSPECMHKAGIPDNFRDMLNVLFIATTDRKLKIEDINIYDSNEKFIRETSKPYGFINVLQILNRHFGYKKENNTNL